MFNNYRTENFSRWEKYYGDIYANYGVLVGAGDDSFGHYIMIDSHSIGFDHFDGSNWWHDTGLVAVYPTADLAHRTNQVWTDDAGHVIW